MITTQISISPERSWSAALSTAIARMIDRIRPSVVQVQSEGRGGGAGVIWRADGRVLTNNHVVSQEGRRVRVALPDGRAFAAAVAARESELDLALLTVDAADLPAAPIGDSARLRVGELVFAVGHPWGQRGVVTAGIVSAVGDLEIANGTRTAQYVRSDVRLAPGNSGGPLLNAKGEVIGINAMIFGGDLAVAIPSHVARGWIAQLPCRRVLLGIQVQLVALPDALRRSLLADRKAGLLVAAVDPDGLAARAGVLIGDVILDVAGTPIQSFTALRGALMRSDTTGSMPLRVLRAGAMREIDVSLDPAERNA